MTNKKLGNDFEQEFCRALAEKGFWVHNMANRSNGQPADVIAVKNGIAYLIDCKVCAIDRFTFSRIEENQRYAMDLWEECGNGSGWFAVKMDDVIYMLGYGQIKRFERNNVKSINKAKMQWNICTLEEWLEVVAP